MTAITGNTYPVRDQLRDLGGKWDADARCWQVPDDKAEQARKIVAGARDTGPRFTRCKVCGVAASRYVKIYRSGECRDCYEERKMGY